MKIVVRSVKLNENMLGKLSNSVTAKRLRPAQLFAERFRMSNENRDVKLAMAQARREEKEQRYQKMIQVQANCSLRYYK